MVYNNFLKKFMANIDNISHQLIYNKFILKNSTFYSFKLTDFINYIYRYHFYEGHDMKDIVFPIYVL